MPRPGRPQDYPHLFRTSKCRREDKCWFRARGMCMFYHDDNERRCRDFAVDRPCSVEPCPYLHTVGSQRPRTLAMGARGNLDRRAPPPMRARDNPYIRKLKPYPLPPDIRIAESAEQATTKKDIIVSSTQWVASLRLPEHGTQVFPPRDMHAAIFVEEAQLHNDLRRYDIEDARLSFEVHFGTSFVKVPCPGLAEKRPSVLVGDVVHIRSNRTLREYTGRVEYVQDNNLLAAFFRREMSQESFERNSFHVVFVLSRTPWKLQHRAIDVASPFQVTERTATLHVDAISTAVPRCRFLEKLNEQQLAFVRRYFTAPTRINILHGPPGTGKTTTLVALVLALSQSDHVGVNILVCTPSNLSTDLIVERIVDKIGSVNSCGFVRRPQAFSRDPKEISERVQRLSLGYNSSVYPDGPPCDATLDKIRVVVTTLGLAAHLYGQLHRTARFQHIIIDEAAQATEPELSQALSLCIASDARLILAGDHKQLGPVLHSALARQMGLGVSALQRLVEIPSVARDCSLMLLQTHRSHPDVLAFYNPTYGKQLIRRADLSDFRTAMKVLPTRRHAALIHVEGSESREPDSPSWMNSDEINYVVSYIAKLLSAGVNHEDIVVLAPYAKQCSKIRQVLFYKFFREEQKQLSLPVPPGSDPKRELVRVKTVEQFQGREARFILLSCVRSKQVDELASDRRHSIGFTDSPQRVNVAVSRAREALIVIGNFRTLCRCEVWRRLVAIALDPPSGCREAAPGSLLWHGKEGRSMRAADVRPWLSEAPVVSTMAPAAETAAKRSSAADDDPNLDVGIDEPLRNPEL